MTPPVNSTTKVSVSPVLSSNQTYVLPTELIDKILLFRQTHPVAKLIQDLKTKCNLCVVCMENPRHNGLERWNNECCSSSCHHQMYDGPWFDYPSFEGQQFTYHINEKWTDEE